MPRIFEYFFLPNKCILQIFEVSQYRSDYLQISVILRKFQNFSRNMGSIIFPTLSGSVYLVVFSCYYISFNNSLTNLVKSFKF